MNFTSIVLIAASLVTLALSFLSWKLISSRSVIFNGLLGSAALLFAAHFAATRDPHNLPLTYIIPFVVSMAFDGRGIGLLMRIKHEPELKTPAYYLFAAGAVSMLGAVVAFLAK